MSADEGKSAGRTLLLAAGFAMVIAVVVFLTRPDGGVPIWKIDASGLEPGGELAFETGKRPVVLSVPEGEGATFGTFMVRCEMVEFQSGPIERDGSLESIWVSDVNADGREDAVILVRSGGSGSYVELFVLEGTAAGFSLRALPDLPVVGKPGYMGHDTVDVREDGIFRSFPSYDATGKARVNRQWTVQDGVRGESPVKTGDDSNAAPSGPTVLFRFEHTTGEWALVTE